MHTRGSGEDRSDRAPARERTGRCGAIRADGSGGSGAERVVVFNPESGDRPQDVQVVSLADQYGFEVAETDHAGHAVELARTAAEAGADVVAAAGGDGTVNEVVEGLEAADALDRVTFGVVPTGTGNNFAGNVGVTGVDHAFEVLDRGERRRIDLGTGDGRIFVNSLVAGLTAEASGETPSELKERFGVLAYVLTTLRMMREVRGYRLTVEDPEGGDPLWDGEALVVLIGNARRFGPERRMQADPEDGLLDVAIVESMPSVELMESAAVYRLLGAESEHVTHFLTPGLRIEVGEGDPLEFSFDGEMASHERLSVGLRPGALEVCVGEGYEPHPED